MNIHFKHMLLTTILSLPGGISYGMDSAPIKEDYQSLNHQALMKFFGDQGSYIARKSKEEPHPQNSVTDQEDVWFTTSFPEKLDNPRIVSIKEGMAKQYLAGALRTSARYLEQEMNSLHQQELVYTERRGKLFLKMTKIGHTPLFKDESDFCQGRNLPHPFAGDDYPTKWIEFCETSPKVHLHSPADIKFLPVMKNKKLEVTHGYWESSARDCILNEQQYTDVGKILKLNYYETFEINPVYGFEPDTTETIGGLADALATLHQGVNGWRLREFTIPGGIGLSNLKTLLDGISKNQTIRTLNYKCVNGQKSVALMGEMVSTNKVINTLDMKLPGMTDLGCLNELGKGLESNKSLSTLMLTLYPPSNDPVFLKFPYYKPLSDEVLSPNEEVDYSTFVQGIEKSKIQDVVVSWNVNMYGLKIPQEVSLGFVQLQQAFRKLPAERFPVMTFPEYKLEDGDVHILFKGGK